MKHLAPARSDHPLSARLRIAGACVFLGILVLVGIAQTSFGSGLARKIGVAAPSERFTELYFADEDSIASATEGFASDTAHQRVSFVISNHESRPMTYRWSVRSAGIVRASGVLALPAGGTRRTTLSRTIPTGCRPHAVDSPRRIGPQTAEILVALAHPADAISYLVDCSG